MPHQSSGKWKKTDSKNSVSSNSPFPTEPLTTSTGYDITKSKKPYHARNQSQIQPKMGFMSNKEPFRLYWSNHDQRNMFTFFLQHQFRSYIPHLLQLFSQNNFGDTSTIFLGNYLDVPTISQVSKRNAVHPYQSILSGFSTKVRKTFTRLFGIGSSLSESSEEVNKPNQTR